LLSWTEAKFKDPLGTDVSTNQRRGLEERSFVFLPGQDKKTESEDGGLIEVHAFRARGRRPRGLVPMDSIQTVTMASGKKNPLP
jgi:hypothetical protein